MVLHLHYHTNPVQLFGCFPDWFWTQTVSSSLNLDNSLVCSVRSSALLGCRSASGSSLCFKVSSHCGCNWSCPCVMGMKSLSPCSKRTCAGLRSESFSGVFLYLSSEMTRWCPLSRVQSPCKCSPMILFAYFTEPSALWLELGFYAAESLCQTTNCLNQELNSPAGNCGPRSVEISSIIPNVAM